MIDRNTSRVLLLGLALILSACGRQSSSGSAAPPAVPAAPTVAKSAAQAKPAPQTSAEKAVESSTIKRINEDGSESVEDTAADNSTHSLLLAAVASTANAATTAGAPGNWQDGVNYTRVVPAQPTAAGADQVEVLEFFWYACPHCYALEPLVAAWKKSKPAYVVFTRVPVMWAPGHRALARLYYTLDSMGKLNELDAAIWKEIHVNNNPLIDPSGDETKSEDIQTRFVVQHGVNGAEFHQAYGSFAVVTDLQKAETLQQRYHVAGVPTFVINGKYITDVGMAAQGDDKTPGEDRLISLLGYLTAVEHKH